MNRLTELKQWRDAWADYKDDPGSNGDNYRLLDSAIEQIEHQAVPTGDDTLWQEIFSLREKLKIAVEAIKSYNPDFDDNLFLHQLNSVDYDQLMEELSGELCPDYQEPTADDIKKAYAKMTDEQKARLDRATDSAIFALQTPHINDVEEDEK